jgi:hypothetical protein
VDSLVGGYSLLEVDGHYLNLPVVESDGRLIGIVDVLKLTYATLEQVSSRGAIEVADWCRLTR